VSISKESTFSLNPLWQFLRKQYSMEEAFRMFGPYRGASIFPEIKDPNTVLVTMPLVVDNTNYVGTHFGGSLYSMCDPFFMFIIMENLGSEYIVWDKSARIDFLKPGRGRVSALFHVSQDEITAIKKIIDKEGKTTRHYEVAVKDEKGQDIANVHKELYIRKNRAGERS
jgi:acyl-coenzyme A thioesterase PaaI-like protein